MHTFHGHKVRTTAAVTILSVQIFWRDLRPTVDPARAGGVEVCGSREHARRVTTLHRGQLGMHVGEGGTLVPGLEEGCMGGLAGNHGAGPELPQGCKGVHVE
jgi:hypothetical protein